MADALRAIAERASSLRERMGPDFVAVEGAPQDNTVGDRMFLWLWAAANGDASLFARRLAWDGLDDAAARRAVGPARLHPHAALPPWTSSFADVLRSTAPESVHQRCLDLEHPVPFEELLVPFVAWSRAACRHRANDAYSLFDEAAHITLERALLRSLSGHASRSFFEELSIDIAMDPLDALLGSDTSRRSYDAFVHRMLSGDLVSFFLEYSALARVLTTTAELWVDATVELFRRYQRDHRAIQCMLGERELGVVTGIATSLSDPHNGLRSVSILTFESGDRVVYKPRHLGIEARFNAWVDWLAELGAPAPLRTFRVVSAADCGWAEYVEYAPCRDREAACVYFERAGALLCLVHLLHGSDCHGDNVIAAGTCPVLIDVETMLSPELRDPGVGAEAPRLARKLLSTSVLNTYLLPFYARAAQDGAVFDGSGFGADLEGDRGAMHEDWICVNTDRMRLARRPSEGAAAPRAAMADGAPLRVYEHEADLVRGFEATYRFLIREKGALLSRGSPFQELADAEVRFVYRNTLVYSVVLRALQTPRFCRDGADRSMQVEQLALDTLKNQALDGRGGWRGIWEAERESVERGDVPEFSVLGGGDELRTATTPSIPGWFRRSGFARAVERLRSLDETDLAFQLDVIRSSLRSRAPSYLATSPSATASGTPAGSLGAEELVSEAVAIARWLENAAIVGSDGSACWLQPAWSRELMQTGPKREVDVVRYDLYEGSSGIGLFLAAIERATKAGLASLALGSVRPVLVELEERGEELASEVGIGGLSGLASIAYALSRMSELLGMEELLVGAERAAGLITDERIAADRAHDVAGGSAGALLGLLSLYETSPSDATLGRAACCGRHLLSRLEPAGHGRAIRTLEGRFLTGFSHGAAGIAYALCRLHAVTGARDLLDGARSLVDFERRTFSEAEGDWPDLRYAGPPRFMRAWCHGAPGIALARIGSLPSADDGAARADIERALAITERHVVDGSDTLCCGTLGIAKVLSTASKTLGRPELSEKALALASRAVQRSRHRGDYVLALPSAGRLRAPGLFQGLSGIGFTLLGLARPGRLPDPLLFR